MYSLNITSKTIGIQFRVQIYLKSTVAPFEPTEKMQGFPSEPVRGLREVGAL